MALADSVSGVSGGTIAFILGFYDEFIFSLDHLVAGTKEERVRAIRFLVKLGSGWIIGSLYAIVQGPTTLDVPKEAMTISSFHVIFFLLGGVILAVLQTVKKKMI